MTIRQAFIPFALALGCSSSNAQKLTLSDLRGSWFFHQHILDSTLFADADRPRPFPKRDYDMMKQQAALSGIQLPDSATYAQMIRQNEEYYRHYRIEYKEDSTYTTELLGGMAKWLPDSGRVRVSDDGALQMLDGLGVVTTDSMFVTGGELHLSLADPMFWGKDGPTMHKELVFRRQQP